MTPLEIHMRAQIAQRGPISVERYMALCLGHPEHGYYMRQDPLGAAGDFTTAPEISQIFGEMLGLWLANAWMEDGQPQDVALVELGPGRGALMADALRVLDRAAPGFVAAADVYLVETSPVLRALQEQNLAGRGAVWLDRAQDIPAKKLYFAANEFFDALPIRQFRLVQGEWRERAVTLENDALSFTDTPLAQDQNHARAERLGLQAYESCPAAHEIMGFIGARLHQYGGAGVVVDYGYDESALAQAKGGDTLQAMRAHAFADPLEAPGQADLTAHVDFHALAQAAGPALTQGPISQGGFLRSLGAEARLAALAKARPDKAEELALGAHRLMDPNEMGRLFKVLLLRGRGS